MAGERVTIQIESNIGEDGPLTVMDTLHQFVDAFELLNAAIAAEPEGKNVRWRLISLTKNSPATAIAEAYSDDPAISVAPLVFRGKKRFSEGMAALPEGAVAPWIADSSWVAKQLLNRNLNGVGRTVFDLEDAPQTIVVEKSARLSLVAIQRFELVEGMDEDKSRSAYGTIDAHVCEARTYHGQPALYVRERLTGKVIPCVLSEQAAKKVGPTHSWEDAWSEKRVRVKGQIFYDRKGVISRVSASSVVDINPTPVDLTELRRLNLLGGKSPTQHIEALWGYDND